MHTDFRLFWCNIISVFCLSLSHTVSVVVLVLCLLSLHFRLFRLFSAVFIHCYLSVINLLVVFPLVASVFAPCVPMKTNEKQTFTIIYRFRCMRCCVAGVVFSPTSPIFSFRSLFLFTFYVFKNRSASYG